jgi:hypothetical protein
VFLLLLLLGFVVVGVVVVVVAFNVVWSCAATEIATWRKWCCLYFLYLPSKQTNEASLFFRRIREIDVKNQSIKSDNPQKAWKE